MENAGGIRGVVYNRYRSIAALASAIGWTRQKATMIVNGQQEPSLDDCDKLAKALDMGLEETARFFLTRRSHKCDYDELP